MPDGLYDEIAHFDRLPVAIIEPFGRSGTDFLSGLFEGHSQIATLPGKFLPDLQACEYDNRSDRAVQKVMEQARFDQHFRLKKIEYDHDEFDSFCSLYLKNSPAFSPRTVLKALHYGWEKVLRNDVTGKKWILWHSHGALFHEHYKELFSSLKNELSIILCCRDPRESLVAYYDYKKGQNSFDYPDWEDSRFILNGLSLKRIVDQIEIYDSLQRADNVYYHRVEHLNICPRESLTALCEFLQIDFEESLLIPEQDNHSGRGLQGFDRRSNIVRWPERLKKSRSLAIVEMLFARPIQELGYPDLICESSRRARLCSILRTVTLFASIRFYRVTILHGWRNARARTKSEAADLMPVGKTPGGCGLDIITTSWRTCGRALLFFVQHTGLFVRQVWRLSNIVMKGIAPDVVNRPKCRASIEPLLTIDLENCEICVKKIR